MLIYRTGAGWQEFLIQGIVSAEIMNLLLVNSNLEKTESRGISYIERVLKLLSEEKCTLSSRLSTRIIHFKELIYPVQKREKTENTASLSVENPHLHYCGEPFKGPGNCRLEDRDKLSGTFNEPSEDRCFEKPVSEGSERKATGFNKDFVTWQPENSCELFEWADALILGPQKTPWALYNKKELEAMGRLIRSFKKPLLGICGGHQMLAVLYGGQVGVKGYSGPVLAYDSKKIRKKTGYLKVELDLEDPLFNGLRRACAFRESHYEEVIAVPGGFRIIAWSIDKGAPEISCSSEKKEIKKLFSSASSIIPENFHVEGIRHETLPHYGLQFHPEFFTEKFCAGRLVLENFLNITVNFSRP